MARYLVVANQTLGGAELRAKVEELTSDGNTTVHLVAPVSRTDGERDWEYPRTDRTAPDAAIVARWLAEARLKREIDTAGVNYVLTRFAFGDLTHEESVHSLSLFTAKVMPEFASNAALA